MKKLLPNHPLLSGAILLTAAGILSRIIGFFYKIFLSREIGAEGLGIYQLIFPMIGICFSLTSAGIQTSISRYVSKAFGMGNAQDAKAYLQMGLALSTALSLFVGALLFRYSDFLANTYLGEARCSSLLKIISFSFVPSSVHACINGYFYGKKQAAIPAVSQLIEQVARVASVYLIDRILISQGNSITISLAVMGLVFGELSGMLFSLSFLNFRITYLPKLSFGKELISMALPLTASRLIVNLFNSVEQMLIPRRLEAFGYTNAEALSVFGVLSGMSLAIIMFPSVITNSVSVILLPTIAEAQAQQNQALITKSIRRTIEVCLLLGFAACLFFFMAGPFLGNFIFENALAGTFIKTLSWICPFLYLNGTLNSILHGLGYPKLTLYFGLLGCLVRILFLYFGLPILGISAYMYGLIASHVLTVLLSLYALNTKQRVDNYF